MDTGFTVIDDIAVNLNNNNDVSNDPFAKNVEIETAADGSADDGFDDDGLIDRGTGEINFDENSPFGNL